MADPHFLTIEFPTRIAPGRSMLWCDPGKMSGVGVVAPDGRVFGYEADWFGANLYIVAVLDRFLELGVADVLVGAERFTISEGTVRKAPDTNALEGIGVCRFEAQRRGYEFDLQMPVEAKRFSTNNRLKAQGWYKSTPGGHVNDALRHLYLRLVKDGRLTPPEGVI